jgi:CRISPR system Cascade subunit CasB
MSVSQTAELSLNKHIGHIAAVISNKRFPTGERAALRRMSPGQPPPLVFYHFAFNYLPENWEHNMTDWMTLVAGIALMSPNAHQANRGVGIALAKAGFSEARLERLLMSEGNTRRLLLLRAARFLNAKISPCNWTEFARLLFVKNEESRDILHRHIARDFYQHTGTE